MNLTSTKIIVPALLAAGAISWTAAQTSQPQSAPAGDGSTKQIALPQIAPPALPEGPGRDVYMIQCGLCHTQRYVTMQPRFSRKVWTDEVNKMINTYKAQVPPDQITTIVDYLVSVRGAEQMPPIK